MTSVVIFISIASRTGYTRVMIHVTIVNRNLVSLKLFEEEV